MKELQCKEFLEALPAVIYVGKVLEKNCSLKLTYVSSFLEKLTGWSAEEACSDPEWWCKNLHPEDRSRVLTKRREKEGSFVYRFRKKDGSYLWIKECFFRKDDSDEVFGIWTDVSQEKEREKELLEKEAILELVVNEAPIGFSVYGEKFVYANPYVERVTGYSLDELKNKYVWDLVHPKYREAVRDIVLRRLKGEKLSRTYNEFILVDKYGRERFIRFYADTIKYKDRFLGLGIGVDITPERNLKRALAEAIYYDPVTGLPNRDLFLEKLNLYIARAKRKKETLMVILLNISNFHEVNTLSGFEGGNLILREVSERLSLVLRKGDLKSRFFADIFGIAITDLKAPYGMWVVLEKIRNVFRRPFKVKEQPFHLSINMGVSLFPKDGEDANELVKKAEIALVRAKEGGEDTLAFYSPEMEKAIHEEVFIRNALIQALKRKEFFLRYQPIFVLRERKVVGAEVLLRWRHPEKGLISPLRFVPIAEKSGIIYEIGRYVLEESVAQLKDSGLSEAIYLSVNFSPKQFVDPDLPGHIEEVLKKNDFPPEKFLLEITESTAMEDPERTKRILQELKKIGIKIAIDDFGMGYCSMHYLIEFEVDKIKVDRSFVMSVLESEKARKVVKMIIELSHNLGAACLAEGIEGKKHYELLLEMGCDEGQGYYLGKPVSLSELKKRVFTA